jgi:hypothetical protein
MSAQLALEAAKKAYELRQAAYGAGDANVREEILAKAINKEIEAESFGKAAKYTRSGAFQGLAAGAGFGVQPGVTLGKLTGALVGGVVASVGAVVGGGIGSAYGAISGPFWDLGQMASHGVRSIIGDFPNWEATSGQKKALEKMVMGAQKTPAPSQEELEEMRDDDGGGATEREDYAQFLHELKRYVPSMPSAPSMPSMPSLPSIPGWGGQSKDSNAGKKTVAPSAKRQAAPSPQSATPKPSSPATRSQAASKSTNSAPKSQAPSTPHEPSKPVEKPPRKKPKKLEVRSTAKPQSQSQPATAKA